MKGSTALAILRNLSEPRLDGFLDLLRTEPSGDDMVAICRFMLDTGITSEAEICNQFQYTKGKYQPKLATIGRRLVTYSVEARNGAIGWDIPGLAVKLARIGQVDAAVDLVRSGLREAAPTEELDLMGKLCEVLYLLPDDLIPDNIDHSLVLSQKRNLYTYHDILERLRVIAQTMDPSTSRQAVTEAMAEPVMAGPERALTKRALYQYWRIRFLVHTVLRERELAIACQEVIIPLLREHPWIGTDHEYELAKQMKLYAMQLQVAGHVERYRAVRDELYAMDLRSVLAQQQRLSLRFPFDIFEAIFVIGDDTATVRQCLSFIDLLTGSRNRFPSTFVTTNLYFCLYGSIATGNQELWQEAASLLPRFARTDFSYLYYHMYRFLEVVHSMDIGDHEEAYRLSKNLRRSEAIKFVQGMDEALGYLMPPLYAVMHKPSLSIDQLLANSWDAARAALVGSALVERFDLTVWYEARREGCTMTEIIRRRTTPLPS